MTKYGKLSPTQQRIMDMTADGLPHLKKDMLVCLDDELSDDNSLRVHICNLRKVLRPLGEDIIAETNNRRTAYRRVRLLNSHG